MLICYQFILLGFLHGSEAKESALQETHEIWVPSLGQEDSLEEEMATHSNILTLGRLQSMGS